MPGTDEPRWLQPDERRAWQALLGVVTRLPGALDTQLLRDADISLFEYFVMSVLSQQPHRTMQLKHLAMFSNGSLSRLSHVITRLETRGWVRRDKDPSNGRITVATLTDEGHQQVVGAAPGHVAEVRRLVFDPLTPQDVHALERVASTIGALLGAPTPDELERRESIPADQAPDRGRRDTG